MHIRPRRAGKTAEQTAALIQAAADAKAAETLALELAHRASAEADATRQALDKLVRAVNTAPISTWLTPEQRRAVMAGREELAIPAPHVHWRPLSEAMREALTLLGREL